MTEQVNMLAFINMGPFEWAVVLVVAVLIFGSDSPGTNAARYYLNPVYGLYAAVTRQTLEGEPAEGWFPDQRLTIEEAIEAAGHVAASRS